MTGQELSVNDIKNLTKTQAEIEQMATELRREVAQLENEENTRHNVAMGEIKRLYNQRIAELNEHIKTLNEASSGLMPVHPRR